MFRLGLSNKAVVNFLTPMIILFAAFQTSLFISKQDKLEVNYPNFSLNLLFSPERPSTFGLEALRRSLYGNIGAILVHGQHGETC